MNNILAAFIMLTRLPFWKIKEVPAECFKHVVPYWPLVGWLTGGVMAAVLWLAGQIMPVSLAWILALIARLLVTGCLHEDGLADFFDGFGGGTTRERTLAIMKGLPHRKLRCHRIDMLFPAVAPTSSPATGTSLHPCALR